MGKKIKKNISTHALLCSICKKRMKEGEIFIPYEVDFAHPSCIKKNKNRGENEELAEEGYKYKLVDENLEVTI